MKQLNGIGASHSIQLFLTFVHLPDEGLQVNEVKVSTGLKMAADFWSQGMFWENRKGKAELKKLARLMQGEEAIWEAGC